MRAGVVTSVSQARSIVEARLTLLVTERRLDLTTREARLSGVSSSVGVWRAFVRRDSWCSLPCLTGLRLNELVQRDMDWRGSGGSSASPASSSVGGVTLAECDDHASMSDVALS